MRVKYRLEQSQSIQIGTSFFGLCEHCAHSHEIEYLGTNKLIERQYRVDSDSDRF